jgi:putative hydrolase of HD superfamily
VNFLPQLTARDPDFIEIIAFIAYLDRLKSVIRQNGLHDDSRAENTAEHSWHAALSAVLLAPYANVPVDIDKICRMLLIHDLIEIEAGDTFVYNDAALTQQEQAEQEAAQIVFGQLPLDQSQDLQALWEEFEARQTPEAKFAKAIDRFLPLYSNFQNKGYSWRIHDVTQSQVRHICQVIEDGSTALWDLAD